MCDQKPARVKVQDLDPVSCLKTKTEEVSRLLSSTVFFFRTALEEKDWAPRSSSSVVGWNPMRLSTV